MVTAEQIDALLPQTQCTRCGYPDCRAYADALARGESDINRCPPGGDETLQQLADLLERPLMPLAPELGRFVPSTVAFVDEPLCIGCTKCIQACPVDAIVGTGKRLHTVIEALCTGCELCLPPCPVDCIRLIPARGVTLGLGGWSFPSGGEARRDALRTQYRNRNARLAKARAQGNADTEPLAAADTLRRKDRRAEIAAARIRVQARRDAAKKS